MKKTVTLFISVLMLLTLAACSVENADIILDNSAGSRFIDFYTEDDYAYIECELNIYSDKDVTVEISALDEDDVKSGLLKNKTLTGFTDNCESTQFSLKSGENTVKVYFRGDYAGIPEISAREIPRFIRIKEAK